MTSDLSVLFVCTANICRSPFMELLARELSGGRLTTSSAGTHGFADHPMNPEMAVGLTTRGISSDAFRSRPLTAALIDAADLVLTAEDRHRRFILDDHPAAFRKVFTLGQFAEAVRQAEELGGRELVAAAGTRRPASDPSQDVDDPYRLGPEAAAASATRIEELLRVIVPALTRSARMQP